MAGRAFNATLAGAMVMLSACSTEPVSVERAMALCEARAREAAGPVSTLEIGADSSGQVTTSVSFGLSTDYLSGRDPEDAFEDCVVARSGEKPTRPYSEAAR